jgi:hypothetical protein
MPKLDLTPANTPDELEGLVEYASELALQDRMNDPEGRHPFDKFVRQYKDELVVAELLDKLKFQAMNRMGPSFEEWQQNQRSKFKPSKIIPKGVTDDW